LKQTILNVKIDEHDGYRVHGVEIRRLSSQALDTLDKNVRVLAADTNANAIFPAAGVV